jgi:hypothetical protein
VHRHRGSWPSLWRCAQSCDRPSRCAGKARLLLGRRRVYGSTRALLASKTRLLTVLPYVSGNNARRLQVTTTLKARTLFTVYYLRLLRAWAKFLPKTHKTAGASSPKLRLPKPCISAYNYLLLYPLPSRQCATADRHSCPLYPISFSFIR